MTTIIQRRRKKRSSRAKNDGWERDALILGDEEAGLESLRRRREINPHMEFRIIDWRTIDFSDPEEAAEWEKQ